MNLDVFGENSITVHGPNNLEELFSSSKLFGISAGIKTIHNRFENSFKDCCFVVDKIPILPLENEFKRRKTEHNLEVYNYHFKVNERTGRLDLNKCIELKVPVGPLLKNLKNGEDILLSNGNLVKQQDVCAPSLPGDEVLIIDCPHAAYLNSLISNEKLTELINQKNSRLKYVFHLSDIDVILEKQYQDWVNQFSPDIKHIGLNAYCSNLAFLATHQQLYLFNQFDSDLFSQPYYEDSPKQLPFESRIKPAEVLNNFDLGTKKNDRRYDKVKLDFKQLEEEAYSIKGLKEAVDEYKRKVKDINSEFAFPEVIFLGTVSAAPSKYRNSSGIFINLNKQESCILDCGEGTLFSIIRQFGPEKYLEKLCNLKFIYCSHLHADHHIGLINILLERERSFNQLNRNPGELALFVPDTVHAFLNQYDRNFEPIKHLFNYKQLPTRGQIELTKEQALKIGLESMVLSRVPHCFQSTGIAIETKTSDNQNYKIVFSGDTLPCEPLVKIGKDCDLLIHEATFSDHFEYEASKKKTYNNKSSN